MTRIRIGVIVLAAIAIVLGELASSARAAEPEWSKKTVLGLAEKLARVLDEAAAAAREAPPQATVLQQRTRDDALRSFDQVRQASGDYVAKLRKGWDRELTEAYFRRVRTLFRDVRKSARDAVPTKELDQKLREAAGLLEELSRFYPGS